MIIADSPTPTKSESTISNGFLRYPISVVKDHGKLSRTLAAFWNLSEVRQRGATHAGLDHIAALANMPVDTVKKQKAALQKRGLVFNRGLVKVTATVWKSRYEIAHDVMQRFEHDEWLLVPKVWQGQFTFAESVVLAFYRYRCGVLNGSPSYCVESLASIAETLGMDRCNVGHVSERLEQRGEIIRRHTPNNNYAVSIPDFEPDYPLSHVIVGKLKGGANEDTPPTIALPDESHIPPWCRRGFQAAG